MPAPYTVDDLNKQFDDLQAALTSGEKSWKKVVSDLKAQIASGVPVTQAQLDNLGARGQAMIDAVKSFDINTPDAPDLPTPEPLPTP